MVGGWREYLFLSLFKYLAPKHDARAITMHSLNHQVHPRIEDGQPPDELTLYSDIDLFKYLNHLLEFEGQVIS